MKEKYSRVPVEEYKPKFERTLDKVPFHGDDPRGAVLILKNIAQ